MYALDTVKTISVTLIDTSGIPAAVKAAFARYDACPYSEWKDDTTTAQKRTRTMRFNKFCALCAEYDLDIPTTLFRLTNAAR